MKLIFIYGSPAAGKLTVAREISARTGFKVFHNHLSIECIVPVFDFGTLSFFRLIDLIRCETIEEAAIQNLDLIYTFCYAKGSDDAHIAEVCERVEKHGGDVCFVQLTSDKETLKARAKNEDRKQFSKASDDELMDNFFNNYDLFSAVPDRVSLRIDNTDIPAEIAAEKIISHYSLK